MKVVSRTLVLGKVTPLGAEGHRRHQFQPSAVGSVEERGEHRQGVQAGDREPVDGAVFGDQRHRPAVPNRCITAEISETVCAIR